MMKFIYDSLDTIKGLKHPTTKQFVTLTIAILVMVILVALYFIFADAIFTSAYDLYYSLLSK
jgi:preprotein translocase SecE subunit